MLSTSKVFLQWRLVDFQWMTSCPGIAVCQLEELTAVHPLQTFALSILKVSISHLFLFSFQANTGWELAAVPRKVNSSMLAPVWWLFSVLSPELVYPSPTTGTTLGHSIPNEVLCMSYTVSGSCLHRCTWRILEFKLSYTSGLSLTALILSLTIFT